MALLSNLLLYPLVHTRRCEKYPLAGSEKHPLTRYMMQTPFLRFSRYSRGWDDRLRMLAMLSGDVRLPLLSDRSPELITVSASASIITKCCECLYPGDEIRTSPCLLLIYFHKLVRWIDLTWNGSCLTGTFYNIILLKPIQFTIWSHQLLCLRKQLFLSLTVKIVIFGHF